MPTEPSKHSYPPAGGSAADATTTSKGIVELATDGENAADVVVQGNDSRLSNARTPTAHAASHYGGGSDPLAGALGTGAAPLGTVTTTRISGMDSGSERYQVAGFGDRFEHIFSDTSYLLWSDTAVVGGAKDSGLRRVPTGGGLRIITASGGTGIGFLQAARELEANTAGSGAPNLLEGTESNKLLTNEGAAAENYATLPSAVAGLEFRFNAIDSDGIRITAAAGDEIEVAGSVSAVAGFIRLATNAKVTLVALNATRWSAQQAAGTITVDS